MQLSETIKSKLDHYHRKLESLDNKLIRLESLVMLNLNKISENISSKNYNNDIALTHIQRKLDSVYDGLSYRVNYMDRKSDMAFEKIQNKIDTTLLRIEKMEENMMQRNSDIEAELSETLFVIEDLKITSESTEQSLLNITTILNQTVSNGPLMNSINLSMQNLITDLNQSITQSLQKLENTSLKTLNVSGDSSNFLKSMKLELKEDFNEYANKVADMNVDIWKRNDVAEETLKTIETVTNSTRTEVQNGVRALILQIGKLSGKGIMNNDKTSMESLRKSVNLSLEKIITNQELFLESCHRVQMDESQIETEISVMLGKLIDMLEKKMATGMKDIKNLEKTLKNHDSRTTRNIYQANTNIVSLFEKTTRSSETAEKELQEIKFYINSLFTFVQDVMPKSIGVTGVTQNHEVILNHLLENITSLIRNTSDNTNIKWIQLEKNFTKQNNISEKMNDQLKNISVALSNIEIDNRTSFSNKMDSFLEAIKNTVSDSKKIEAMANAGLNTTGSTSISSLNSLDNIKKTDCAQDYSNLIDLRADEMNCNISHEDVVLNKHENTEPPLYHTTNDNDNQEKLIGQTTTVTPQDDEEIKKAVLELFGTPPPSGIDTTENPLNKTDITATKAQTKCSPAWANFLNIRAASGIEGCNTRFKSKKNRKKTKTKLNVDDVEYEYADSIEAIDGTTEESNTETLTESDISTTEINVLENLE